MVTKAELKQFLPTAKASLIDAVVDNWAEAEKEGITTPRRIRQFLCNIAVETGGLRAIAENMNYTSAARIQATWPSRFKTLAAAKPYVKQPKKLAIKVYGGRMGNASAPSEDGWIYRGGGMLQTTGREGYRKMGFEQNPGTLQTNAKVAFLTAVREWGKRGCNALADKDDTTGVRKAINGGTNGLSDVKNYLATAKKVWPDDAKASPAPKPKNSTITNPVIVKDVQVMLKQLGYTEVGGADGIIGTMTRGAILAFRAENNLPLSTVIDDQFMEALKTAQPRAIAVGRVAAPVKDVVAKVPEVKANFISKIISAITAFFSTIVAAVMGIFDQFDAAKAYIDPLKEYAADVPGWVWFLVIALVAAVIFGISRHGEKKGVEAFQNGERR
ncbi:glycoside hydrolase family 19 protein [Brucella intermedia]|uniref:glycoside hydrolase family 19 protein n=1 Tax=Brucella intermedia TaxID=94625 RepID=UPI00224B37D5|nr:peptidoglycan-binding protein [Brucella intermedia]